MLKKIFSISMLLIISFSLTACRNSIDVSAFKDKQGNTNPNIVQGGFAARDGYYVYFNTDDRLYEMDIRDGKILILHDINPLFGYLNVVHPYIICVAEDRTKPERPGRLILYTLDGKYAKVLDKKIHVPILVVDEWIYATAAKDGPLYSWRVNGTKKTLLTDDPVGEFHVLGEWIYYKTGFKIKKMRLDGSEKSDVLPDKDVGSFYVEEDTNSIYYRCLEDNKIYRTDLDRNLTKVIVDYPCLYFQKKSMEIFYQNKEHELYCISLTEKDSKPEKIADNIAWLNILDDIILIKDNDMNVYILDELYKANPLELPEP